MLLHLKRFNVVNSFSINFCKNITIPFQPTCFEPNQNATCTNVEKRVSEPCLVQRYMYHSIPTDRNLCSHV